MCVYLTLPYLTWYVRTLSVHNASLIYWKFIQPLKTAGIGLTHSTGPINAALLYLLSAQPPFTNTRQHGRLARLHECHPLPPGALEAQAANAK